MALLFQVKTTLCCRDSVRQLPDEETDGLLLAAIGEPSLRWDEGESRCGYDQCSLRAAIYKGERCWILGKSWCAAYGYSAEGFEQKIISFEEGVKYFLQQEVFKFPLPAEEKLEKVY